MSFHQMLPVWPQRLYLRSKISRDEFPYRSCLSILRPVHKWNNSDQAAALPQLFGGRREFTGERRVRVEEGEIRRGKFASAFL